MKNLKTYSVVVLTYNAQKYIKKQLNLLLSQTIKPKEILIIDSSSKDGTARIVENLMKKFSIIKLKIIPQGQFNHGLTRDMGMKLTSGDIVVFMTQDAIPYDNKLIENLLSYFRDSSVASVYARQVPRKNATPPEKFSRLFNYPAQDIIKDKTMINKLGIKTFFCSNVCNAIRRKHYNKMGGFTETIMGEDLFLAAKFILHGYKVAYSAKAKVYHSHELSLVNTFKRYFDTGVAYRNNEQIFADIRLSGEGFRFIKSEIAYLLKHSHYTWIPYTFIEVLYKYIGFKLGWHYRFLPRNIILRFTALKHYWESTISQK